MQTSSIIYRNGNNGRGILGGFFTMGGHIYGLSNNHVIADINNCTIGDPIFDQFGNIIGNLSNWVSLKSSGQLNLVDVALFRYTAVSPPVWALVQASGAKPPSFVAPVQNGYVYIVRPDGTTRTGYISIPYTSQAMDLILCGSHFLFSHLIEITPLDGNPFAVPGASGSVVLTSHNNMIVGVITGTAKDGVNSYAVPFIDGILNYYPLTI